MVITAPKSITSRQDAVQKFHRAWFGALELQDRDFDKAAAHIAAWGHNDWTGVTAANAASDWDAQLRKIAQADLAQNVAVLAQPAALMARIDDARVAWTRSGAKLVGTSSGLAVDGQFAQQVAVETSARGGKQTYSFPNTTFAFAGEQVAQSVPAIEQAATATIEPPTPSVTPTSSPATATPDAQQTPGAQPSPTIELIALNAPTATAAPKSSPTPIATAAVAQTTTVSSTAASKSVIAVLPCARFEFVPESDTLLAESKQLLDDCAVKTLKQTVNVILRIDGSAAWPGPAGTYTRQDIENIALRRAEAIAAYLVEQGVDKRRLFVTHHMPPQPHWESTDLDLLAQDRYVALSLLTGGR